MYAASCMDPVAMDTGRTGGSDTGGATREEQTDR